MCPREKCQSQEKMPNISDLRVITLCILDKKITRWDDTNESLSCVYIQKLKWGIIPRGVMGPHIMEGHPMRVIEPTYQVWLGRWYVNYRGYSNGTTHPKKNDK
jgi:hypothetical protein